VIGDLRRLASLSAVTETETAFAGRSRLWVPVADLWVQLSSSSVTEVSEAGQMPRRRQTLTAEARDLAAAAPGQRLTLGADVWRVRSVDHDQPRPGRMTLFLESDVA
jgi:hypothetical protein